jgi:hypothetical protein
MRVLLCSLIALFLAASGRLMADGETAELTVDQVGVRVLSVDERDATRFWISAKARVTNATKRAQSVSVTVQLFDAQEAQVETISLGGDVPPSGSAILTDHQAISTNEWVRVSGWKATNLRGREAAEPDVVARDITVRREEQADTFLLEATLENKSGTARTAFDFRVRAVDAEGYEVHVHRMTVQPPGMGGHLGPGESQRLSERLPLFAVPWSEIAGWNVKNLTCR